MRSLSKEDVSAGLPASAAATALLGKAGASTLLVLLFLAVTSASSAELIAVSSILTYDVYKVTLLILWLSALLMKDFIEIHKSARDRRAGAQGRARDGESSDCISYSLVWMTLPRLLSSRFAWASPEWSSIILASRWDGFMWVAFDSHYRNITEES